MGAPVHSQREPDRPAKSSGELALRREARRDGHLGDGLFRPLDERSRARNAPLPDEVEAALPERCPYSRNPLPRMFGELHHRRPFCRPPARIPGNLEPSDGIPCGCYRDTERFSEMLQCDRATKEQQGDSRQVVA